MEAFAQYFTQITLMTLVLYILMWTYKRSFQIKTDRTSTMQLISTFALLFMVSIGFTMMMEIKYISHKPIAKKAEPAKESKYRRGDYASREDSDAPARDIPPPAPMRTSANLDVQIVNPDKIETTFKDVVGLTKTKKELQGIINLIKNESGAPTPKGILLYGPPGTGKTLIARAFAKEANVNLLSVTGADFEDKYIGEGPNKVRYLFALARQNAPCIIFVDEIDTMAPSRKSPANQHAASTVNKLLSELDNFDEARNEGVIFLAATNHIEAIDPALLRPGRFDKKIHLSLPNVEERKEILVNKAEKYNYKDMAVLNLIAEKTRGYSPAELENVINNAITKAQIAGRKTMNKQDLMDALAESELQMINFAKSKQKLEMDIIPPSKIKTTFNDIAGYMEAKQDVQQTLDFLRSPQKYREMGAILPKGVLFYGPPGTGKTLFARAMAGESGVTFISTNGSAFVKGLVGQGAEGVRELFTTARDLAPAVIFIDEIDTLLRSRAGSGGYDGGANEYAQTTNEFLAQMDNINEMANQGIIVVGATNRLESLDSAAIRPGRFDKKIFMRLPNLNERKAIVTHYLGKVKASKNLKPLDVAQGTGGFSGADIKNLINLSALRAVEMKRKEIILDDIEYAKDTIVLGKESKSANVMQEERRNTAIHEAGHTLVQIFSKNHPFEFYKVTIGVRDGTLGVTHFQETNERYGLTREMYIDFIATLQGGRLAEELIFGRDQVTGGASNDLMRATQMARQMVEELVLGDNKDMLAYKYLSAPPVDKINEQINDIIEEARSRAWKILTQNEKALRAIADKLLQKEILMNEEVMKIIQENK